MTALLNTPDRRSLSGASVAADSRRWRRQERNGARRGSVTNLRKGFVRELHSTDGVARSDQVPDPCSINFDWFG